MPQDELPRQDRERYRLLTPSDTRGLWVTMTLWPVFPMTLWALARMARVGQTVPETPPANGLVRWVSVPLLGLRMALVLMTITLPGAGMAMIGLAGFLQGNPGLRWAWLAFGSVSLAWTLLSLPGWLRLHGNTGYRSVRPLWRAFLVSVSWPLMGDTGFWRVVPAVVAGWLGLLAPSLMVGWMLSAFTGGFAAWFLGTAWLLLPLPLTATLRAVSDWEERECNARGPVSKGRKPARKPGRGRKRKRT